MQNTNQIEIQVIHDENQPNSKLEEFLIPFPEGSTFINQTNILEEESIIFDAETIKEKVQLEKESFLIYDKLPKIEITKYQYSKEFGLEAKIENFEENKEECFDWTNQREGHLKFESASKTEEKSHYRSREEVELILGDVSLTGKNSFFLSKIYILNKKINFFLGNINNLSDSVIDQKIDYETQVSPQLEKLIEDADSNRKTSQINVSFGRENHILPPILKNNIEFYQENKGDFFDNFSHDLGLVKKTSQKKRYPPKKDEFKGKNKKRGKVKKNKEEEKLNLEELLIEFKKQIKEKERNLIEFSNILEQYEIREENLKRKMITEYEASEYAIYELSGHLNVYQKLCDILFDKTSDFIHNIKIRCENINILRMSIDLESQLKLMNDQLMRKSTLFQQKAEENGSIIKDLEFKNKDLENHILHLEEELDTYKNTILKLQNENKANLDKFMKEKEKLTSESHNNYIKGLEEKIGDQKDYYDQEKSSLLLEIEILKNKLEEKEAKCDIRVKREKERLKNYDIYTTSKNKSRNLNYDSKFAELTKEEMDFLRYECNVKLPKMKNLEKPVQVVKEYLKKIQGMNEKKISNEEKVLALNNLKLMKEQLTKIILKPICSKELDDGNKITFKDSFQYIQAHKLLLKKSTGNLIKAMKFCKVIDEIIESRGNYFGYTLDLELPSLGKNYFDYQFKIIEACEFVFLKQFIGDIKD